jgi:hypothetical protein
VVRRLFAEALAGASLRSLAQELTARGIPSPKGRAGWSHVSVRYLLTQTVYTGEAYGLRYELDKNQQYVGIRGASTGRWKSRQQVRPREEWVRLPEGYAPQLIEPDAWQAVQQVLRGRQRAGRKPKDPGRVLMAGGRARCADCGSALTLVSNKPPALMCSGRTSWRSCASRPYIRAADLDAAALTLARRIFEHPNVIADQAEQHRQQDPTTADLAMVERTLQDVEQRMQAIAAVAEQVRTPEAAAPLALQLETLAAQQRQAQQDRQQLLDRRAGWEASQRFLDGFAGLCAQVRRRLDRFDRREWQQAIDALGITAVVRRAPAPDRFVLSTRLDGLLTEALVRRLAPELQQLGCQLSLSAGN